MARKRGLEEVEKFNEVDKAISNASIYGVLTSVSPVKKGRRTNYFEGTVSDGNSKLRLVGFDTKQQKRMDELMAKKKAIAKKNCEIKQSRRGDKMEILLKTDTSVGETAKKIEVSDMDFEDDTPEVIKLDDLQSKYVFAKVTVNVKLKKKC